MISYLDDINRICPGLWTEFCQATRGDAQLWAGKLEGSIPCLDRDWRKLVFKLLDYYAITRGITPPPHRQGVPRLDVIVHPFKIYYGHTFPPDEATQQVLQTICPSNFLETWPWSADAVCRAFFAGEEIEMEASRIFDLHAKELTDKHQSGVWWDLGRLAFTGDVHDLGRIVFTSMNSCTRRAILDHNDLQYIMTMIQHNIDADVQNKNALRKILVDIVNECRVLPQCLKIMDVSRERSGNAEGLVSTGGGFADIFLGRYRNVMVALKRLRGITVGADLDKLVAFLREAIAWRQLHHKNILPFYGIDDTLFEPAGTVVLVSPWIERGDLASFVKPEKSEKVEGVNFMIQIAHGLDYLHSHEPQIVHGDLRGSNILMDVENGALRLRITDFGISRIEQIYTNSASYMAKGAGRWMAPEILMPSESQSGRPTEKSDVYAYAMTCIEIFSGYAPFQGLPRSEQVTLSVMINDARPQRPPAFPVAQDRGLDDEIWGIIKTCWQKDDSRRPLIQDVRQHLSQHEGLDDSRSDTSSVEMEAFPL